MIIRADGRGCHTVQLDYYNIILQVVYQFELINKNIIIIIIIILLTSFTPLLSLPSFLVVSFPVSGSTVAGASRPFAEFDWGVKTTCRSYTTLCKALGRTERWKWRNCTCVQFLIAECTPNGRKCHCKQRNTEQHL